MRTSKRTISISKIVIVISSHDEWIFTCLSGNIIISCEDICICGVAFGFVITSYQDSWVMSWISIVGASEREITLGCFAIIFSLCCGKYFSLKVNDSVLIGERDFVAIGWISTILRGRGLYSLTGKDDFLNTLDGIWGVRHDRSRLRSSYESSCDQSKCRDAKNFGFCDRHDDLV